MTLLKYILTFTQKTKESCFWRNPDNFLAAIILNKDRDQVYGIVKKNLARLERIPRPETGFFYKDIVKVKGPIGTQLFRDDEIAEYEATEIYKPSNISTYTFKAIISKSTDYFKFLNWFKEHGQKVEFPWSSNENTQEWRNGRCTANNLEQAKKILNSFIENGEGRQVKEINYWDHYLKRKK